MDVLVDLLHLAKKKGIKQADLAKVCGITAEALSRMKRRGSTSTEVLACIANQLDIKIVLLDSSAILQQAISRPSELSFKEKYATQLAWSNQSPSTDLLIRKALLNPQIQILVDAAYEFGFQRVLDQWSVLIAEKENTLARIRPTTDRMLRHIEDGIKLAAS